jgi:hypothetical protein
VFNSLRLSIVVATAAIITIDITTDIIADITTDIIINIITDIIIRQEED